MLYCVVLVGVICKVIMTRKWFCSQPRRYNYGLRVQVCITDIY